MPLSAIYEGRIEHRRFRPRRHDLSYPVFLMYLDLAELPDLFDGHRGWSARGRSLAEFRRSDYLGPGDVPLDRAVRDRVEAAGLPRPAGPIRVLTHLRYLGFVFNPASFYYCYDRNDARLEAVIVEVTNTPWKERISYVLSPGPDSTDRVLRASHGKELHVSPFMPMDQSYRWRIARPGKRLGLHVEDLEDGEIVLGATVALERREITKANLRRALRRFPALTARVMLWIHLHALLLWLKGVPVHTHPRHLENGTGP